MSNQTQNKLFHYIISNTEIDNIQSRFISYKLELNKVQNILQIEMINEHIFIVPELSKEAECLRFVIKTWFDSCICSKVF